MLAALKAKKAQAAAPAIEAVSASTTGGGAASAMAALSLGGAAADASAAASAAAGLFGGGGAAAAAFGGGSAAPAGGAGSKLGGMFGGGGAAGGAKKKSKWGKVRAVKSMLSAVKEFAQLPGLHQVTKEQWKSIKNAIEWDELDKLKAIYAELRIEINNNPYYNPIIETRGRRRQSSAAIGLGTNWKGYGACHHAAASSSPKVLAWCLSQEALNITGRCREGLTILRYAELDDARGTDGVGTCTRMIKAELARRGEGGFAKV